MSEMFPSVTFVPEGVSFRLALVCRMCESKYPLTQKKKASRVKRMPSISSGRMFCRCISDPASHSRAAGYDEGACFLHTEIRHPAHAVHHTHHPFCLISSRHDCSSSPCVFPTCLVGNIQHFRLHVNNFFSDSCRRRRRDDIRAFCSPFIHNIERPEQEPHPFAHSP